MNIVKYCYNLKLTVLLLQCRMILQKVLFLLFIIFLNILICWFAAQETSLNIIWMFCGNTDFAGFFDE